MPRFLSASAARTTAFSSARFSRSSPACVAKGANSSQSRDWHLLAADLVAQAVVADERVRRDLLQELDGGEGAVVHLVLVDHVPGTRVALEASLERSELRRRIVGGLADRLLARAIDDGRRVRVGVARPWPLTRLTWLASRPDAGAEGATGATEGGIIEKRTSTSSCALASRRDSLMSGGWMLLRGATW